MNGAMVVDAIRQSQIDNYVSLASVVVVYYEFFVTLDDEVRFFWRRSRGPRRPWYRLNTMTVLFFLNRYIPVVMNATIIAHNLGNIPTSRYMLQCYSPSTGLTRASISCSSIFTLDQVMVVTVQLIVGMVTGIRTYALYERSRAVWKLFATLFVFGLGIGLVCVLLAEIIHVLLMRMQKWSVLDNPRESQAIHIPSRFGCHTALSDEAGRRLAAAWIVLMVYDATVFFLTLKKALQIWKLGSSRLFRILIRDGSIFFFVMTMANFSNVLVLMLAPPFLKDICTTFTSAISVTMVSRLMLNVQDPSLLEEPITRANCTTPEIGTLVTNFVEEDSLFISSANWTIEEP